MMKAAPRTSFVTHAPSRTLTTNQPSLTGVRPASSRSRRASWTISAPLLQLLGRCARVVAAARKRLPFGHLEYLRKLGYVDDRGRVGHVDQPKCHENPACLPDVPGSGRSRPRRVRPRPARAAIKPVGTRKCAYATCGG